MWSAIVTKNGVEECSRFRVHSLLSIRFFDLALYFSLQIAEHACGGIREDAATPLQSPWFTV